MWRSLQINQLSSLSEHVLSCRTLATALIAESRNKQHITLLCNQSFVDHCSIHTPCGRLQLAQRIVRQGSGSVQLNSSRNLPTSPFSCLSKSLSAQKALKTTLCYQLCSRQQHSRHNMSIYTCATCIGTQVSTPVGPERPLSSSKRMSSSRESQNCTKRSLTSLLGRARQRTLSIRASLHTCQMSGPPAAC